MKYKEKLQACRLRSQGKPIGEIAQILQVSKASVSVWVRDVKLTLTQRKSLYFNQHNRLAIEKRRISRLTNEKNGRDLLIEDAGKEIGDISHNELRFIGISLYWAEGRKRGKRTVDFSNSDPSLIIIMMRFFREICLVSEEKFRAHIHTHSHVDVVLAEAYWSDITHIPLTQFHKTYCKPSSAGNGKMDRLPYGTIDISIYDVKLYLKIMGWIKKVEKMLTIGVQ